jgi:hypothetical protein
VAALPKLKNNAAPQAAGYIRQLERALYHLALAGHDDSVAVELVDDVSVSKNSQTILQEQDKNTVREGVELLGDRSKALWRTFQIWLTQIDVNNGAACKSYLLVSNAPTKARIATLLKGVADGTATSAEVIAALRNAGSLKSGSRLQEIVDDVLARSDESLNILISRVEIVDNFDISDFRDTMANGLAINYRSDAQAILDNILGWLTRTLQELWQAQKPGVISRKACVTQCREVENLLARQRFLPRPARDVLVDEAARDQALARPFVEHLTRIDAEDLDVFQAVDHFIRFNVEKHRLAVEGEVPDREWRDRGDRLQQRWVNIALVERRENPLGSSHEVGQRIWPARHINI